VSTLSRKDQFDFAFQPSIDEREMRELRTLRFVHEAGNVLFLGPPGVGKTHLAVALTEEAIRAGFSAQFITVQDLVSDLGRAARAGRLAQRLRAFITPKVLVVDEIGYLPLDEVGATLFFQLVTARYERGSTILTSNKESPPQAAGYFNDECNFFCQGQTRCSWKVRFAPEALRASRFAASCGVLTRYGIKALATGAAPLAMQSWRRLCWISCCTTPPSSTSEAKATASKNGARPVCWRRRPAEKRH